MARARVIFSNDTARLDRLGRTALGSKAKERNQESGETMATRVLVTIGIAASDR